MKIKTDFVTNSSSVSFIVAMHEEIVEIFSKFNEGLMDVKTKRIIKTLSTDLKKNGTMVYLEGEVIYTKKFKFQTDGDCMWDDSFEKPIDKIDFSPMSDEDLWAYIFGEYILNGRISHLKGFGAVQVETY